MLEELRAGSAGLCPVVPDWGAGPLGVGRSAPVDVDDLGAGVGFGFEGGIGLAFGRGGVGVGAVDEPGEAFVLVGVAGDDEVAAPFEGDVEQVGELVDVSFGGDVPVEHGEDDAVVAVGVAVGKVCGRGDGEGSVGGLLDLDGVAELEGVVDGLVEVLSGVGGDSPVVHGVSAPVRGWVL